MGSLGPQKLSQPTGAWARNDFPLSSLHGLSAARGRGGREELTEGKCACAWAAAADSVHATPPRDLANPPPRLTTYSSPWPQISLIIPQLRNPGQWLPGPLRNLSLQPTARNGCMWTLPSPMAGSQVPSLAQDQRAGDSTPCSPLPQEPLPEQRNCCSEDTLWDDKWDKTAIVSCL